MRYFVAASSQKITRTLNLVMQLLQKYHFNFKNVSHNLLVAVLYVLLAKIGLFFVLKSTTITIFWPAGGFALAVLLLGGLKYLPGIFIGAMVTGFMVIDSPWVVTVLGMANMMESFSAYWLLTNRFNFNPALETRQDFIKLVLLAAGIGSAISALIGPTALLVGNIIPASLYPTICLRWWMGDVLGIAFITPLILIWKNPPQTLTSKLNAFEVLTIYALTLLVGQIIFFDWLYGSEYYSQSVSWLVLLIIWAGSRSGRHNTSALQLIIFIEALWSASHGVGHYANDMVKSGLVNFWMFGMLLAVGGMAMAVITDESRKIQEILRKTEFYQRALLDNFPFAVWLKDTESRFLSVNKSFASIFGVQNSDEFVGKTDFDISPSDLAEKYQADDRTVLVSHQKKNVEEEVLIGETLKWFETYKAPVFDDKGAILGTVGFARDITERKCLDQMLRDKNADLEIARSVAEEANLAKSTFLSRMSHEIRTPMNAIMGMAHLTLLTDLTAKQRNYLDKINTSAKWLLGILNDILDFSKLEAGKLKLEHTEFSLETVMQYLADVTSPLLEGKPLALSFEVDPDVPTVLIGDPLRLGQVLLNLLSNAIKFTEQGTVTLHMQLQASDAREASFRFSVIDTGIGLNEEQQSHLFSAFNQADDSTTRKYGGTGLGLSISKELVEAMGGTIDIESRLGLGSTFYFTVTLGLQAVSEFDQPTPQTVKPKKYPQLSNVYLLFVEDDLAIREMMPELLGYEGIRVDLATNGSEAITMIGMNNYSMVLMDCQMPVMDGFEASRIIRADPRFTDLPIIAMTGNVMTEDRERCLASGMSDHIGKPIDWDQFFQTLARWVKPADHQCDPTIPASQSRYVEPNLADRPLQPSSVVPLSGDVPTHQQLLDELDSLLANDSFINDELLTQLKMLFLDDNQAEYNILTQYILDTDYPKAKSVLNTRMGLPNEKVERSDQDQRPTILIVDDTRVNLEVLALLLNQNYQVKVAGNGQRALDIAQCSPHLDLVLLDVRMPEMSGYDVCQRLQENPLTRSIPVIFVTAAFDQESEIYGLQLGAVDYISKPISPAITLLRVHNHVLIKQHKKELKRIAHYDALTGIPNRVLLADRMKQAIAHTKRKQKMLAICYLDLDGFKPVNDTWGHQSGDQVLIEIAQRIGNILREGDTVARLGGDEFVVLLPSLNHVKECIATLKRLHEIIALPIYIQDQSFSLTASIGVSIFPNDDNDPDVLLGHADQAMYVAKQSGKNRYHLYNPIDDQ